MVSGFVTREELAALVECQVTSRACMRRWLIKRAWPFEEDRNGFPKVLRAYYEQRMMGAAPAQPTKSGSTEPDFSCFGIAK